VACRKHLIADNIDHRFLGIFGEPGVNTLRLNLALDLKHNGASSGKIASKG
jgi:K+-transporting ATPase c subunit